MPFNMKLIILHVILVCGALGTSITNTTTPVPVIIFYETHCPDSIRFITKQFYPTYKQLTNYMEPFFVPYGKAQREKRSVGLQFTCQHGPEECKGNMYHACVVNLYAASPTLVVEYIHCTMDTMTGTHYLWQECAKKFKLNYKTINDCVYGEMGSQLLARMGEITDSLRPPLTYVPTIVFVSNDLGLPNDSKENEVNFMKEVCTHVESTFLPRECTPVFERNVGNLAVTLEAGGRILCVGLSAFALRLAPMSLNLKINICIAAKICFDLISPQDSPLLLLASHST